MTVRALAVLAVTFACGQRTEDPAATPPAPRPRPASVDSNIAARDYIGPAACGECHPDEHAQWQASLHRVMNQTADDPDGGGTAGDNAAVIGDFDDARFADDGGEVSLARDDRGYTMAFARDGRTVRYRVTRTIGRRALQEYVGIEEGGPPGDKDEVRLPIGWWPRRGGWYPQAYFDPWLAEDDLDVFAPVREPWAERCPWCHSTYPFAQRIARASARAVGHGLEQYFVAEPGGPRLAVAEQVTVGISCESCHLGGRAHAKGAPIHLVPLGAEPRQGAPIATTFAVERRDPAILNGVCAQCHSGPSPRFPDQTATRNSSEAIDLAASPCTTARCTDCHDPHRGGSDEARAIAACTGCHATLADADAARRHAGTGHAAVTCLDCHMPRVVMGIDRYVRTHRISSPTDRVMLAAAAPNACNLCHLDRTIAWTTDELRAQWDVSLDPTGWDAYGEAGTSVGEVWRASNDAAIRVIAAMAYARSKLGRYALVDLIAGLDDPLPYVRSWTMFAVEDVMGRKLRADEYDPRAPRELRRRQIARLRAR